MRLSRRAVLAAAVTLPAFHARAADPILAGVSGPLTGPNAQYGAQWKTRLRPRARRHQRRRRRARGVRSATSSRTASPTRASRSRSRRSSSPTRKIVIELGDFSSPASMAASPIYQRAKLVQFGFTNSHPNFTKGGDYMWSNSTNQADEQPQLAKYAAKLGLKRPPCCTSTPTGAAPRRTFLEAATAWASRSSPSKATCRPSRTSARPWSASATPSPTASC